MPMDGKQWELNAEEWMRQIADFTVKPDYSEWNVRSFLDRLKSSIADAHRISRQKTV